MKKEINIELNEKELIQILANHFETPIESSKINVYKFDGGQREQSYTKITFTAPYKK